MGNVDFLSGVQVGSELCREEAAVTETRQVLHVDGLRRRRRHLAPALRVLHGERAPAGAPDLHPDQRSARHQADGR